MMHDPGKGLPTIECAVARGRRATRSGGGRLGMTWLRGGGGFNGTLVALAGAVALCVALLHVSSAAGATQCSPAIASSRDGCPPASGYTVDPNTPFASLASGYTQSLFASSGSFLGGVAFAPDGSVWTDQCLFSGSELIRFSSSSSYQQNGAGLAATSTVPSNAGCGLANNPDGRIYSNTSDGIVQIDASTGAALQTLGQPGNALGVTTDPQSGNVIYVAQDCRFSATCTILSLNPATGSTAPFAQLPSSQASFVDGIAFDPSGSFLFLSTRAPSFAMTVLNRKGDVVQQVAMNDEPDGIAFHSASPNFVVTDDTDGNMTRFVFPNNDYTQPPAVDGFASGGYRGDLSAVGPDQCIYLTQDGTNFPDGTSSSQDSIAKICPGFAPSPGVGTVSEPAYVAFGDSVSTGYSVKSCGKFDLARSPWGCTGQLAAEPYPDRVAAALGYSYSDDPNLYAQFFPAPPQQGYPSTDLDRVGIWGDTASAELAAYGQPTNPPGPWLPQFNAVEHAHGLVTGALGANDLHFSNIASWLIPYLQNLNPLDSTDHVKQRADALLASAGPALDQMVASMQAAKAHGAKAVVVLYYNPFDSGSVLNNTICQPTNSISTTIVNELDNALQNRAQTAALRIADPRSAFAGHGAGSGDPLVFGTDCSPAKAASELIPSWVPFIGGGGFKAIAQDFDPHPNDRGTNAIAQSILKTIG